MHLYHQSESIYDDQGLRNYSLKLRYFYLKFRNTQKIKRNECSVIAGGCSVNAIYEQIFPGVPSRLWDREVSQIQIVSIFIARWGWYPPQTVGWKGVSFGVFLIT